MGRTIPMPIIEDFERARGLISEGGEIQVIAIAQLIAENRWLSNIIHMGVHTSADVETAFNEGRDQGFLEGQQSMHGFEI